MPDATRTGPPRARAHDTHEIRLTSTDRILVVAPHPDDDILAAGGLLQHATDRGASVRILYVTRGENNPWAQRAHERRWRIGPTDRERWGNLRQREALESLACLGLSADCARSLTFPDQGLTDFVMSGGRGFVELLADEIAFWKPTLVLVPATFDAHPDHSSLATLAEFALARVPSVHLRPQTLGFVIHFPKHPVPPAIERFKLTPAQIGRKRLAILHHRSQLHLRRRFLLGFCGESEPFHAVSSDRVADAYHPVREAFMLNGVLHIMVRRPMGLRISRPELLVAVEGSKSDSLRFRVTFDVTAGDATLHDTMNGDNSVPVAMHLRPDMIRFEIPRVGEIADGPPAILFAKLDRPNTRRMGFFDTGWRRLHVSGPATSQAGDVQVPKSTADHEVVHGTF